jgi:hypothetical protein
VFVWKPSTKAKRSLNDQLSKKDFPAAIGGSGETLRLGRGIFASSCLMIWIKCESGKVGATAS